MLRLPLPLSSPSSCPCHSMPFYIHSMPLHTTLCPLNTPMHPYMTLHAPLPYVLCTPVLYDPTYPYLPYVPLCNPSCPFTTLSALTICTPMDPMFLHYITLPLCNPTHPYVTIHIPTLCDPMCPDVAPTLLDSTHPHATYMLLSSMPLQ